MTRTQKQSTQNARTRLVAAGGRIAQDFGFSRISGQILMQLYLTEGVASLDEISEALDLSKAAASISCTQLESLGLIVRVRQNGDRKRYYRSADNLQQALTVGIAGFVKSEVVKLDAELRAASTELLGTESAFLEKRVRRLAKLNNRVRRTLENPVLKFVAKIAK